MRKCYIIFEYFEDVKCEKTHESPYDTGKDGKPKQYRCNHKIRCSRIVRLVTTDKELAIRLTKHKPSWSYQEETLWAKISKNYRTIYT